MTRSPKAKKRPWPDEVPVLVAGDLVWNYSAQDGRHDLQVWLERTFYPDAPYGPDANYCEAYVALCGVITERFGRTVKTLSLFLEFTRRKKMPSLAWQAACWNEMLACLGYTVPKKSRIDPGFNGHES